MEETDISEQEPKPEHQIFEHSPVASYTIEAVADLAQVPRRVVMVYQRHGLVVPASDSPDSASYFDDRAIQVLRRMEYLRRACRMNLKGIKLMMDLTREVERLREEVRFFYRQ
jgi:DNA-binding transcriptional MerR regulator